MAWRTADAMVVPGGTPIADALGPWPLEEVTPLVDRAVAAGLPIVFVGIGTETLRSPESRRLFADRIALNVRRWTVRSARDERRLIEYGVPPERVTVAADMAWNLEPASPEFGRRVLSALGIDPATPLIGVNVNIEPFVRAAQPALLSALAAALDETAARHGARVVFMCNETRDGETYDLAASREVIGCMRHPELATIVPNRYWVPQEMMSMVACCRLTVSTRYHYCIFSVLQGVPFVAIERSDKVSDLSADLAWPHSVSLPEVGAGTLPAALCDAWTERDGLVALARTGTRLMRERAARNVLVIDALRGRAQGGR